ncbi:MAG: hypothetical protein ACNA8G_05755 [Gammaproteobacteria bacterium]
MRNFQSRCLAALVAVTLFGGCAYLRDGDVDEAQAPGESIAAERAPSYLEAEIISLASIAETLPHLPRASQRDALEAAARDYAREGGVAQRLRLALVLTLADKELQNLEWASELLAEPVTVPEHPAGDALSQLLSLVVAQVQLAQEQRTALVAQQAAQCAALQQRLDRLKDIEKQINERAQLSRLPIEDD